MYKYVFPAILTPCEDGSTGYYVNFPDLEHCFTDGNDLADAVYMASDVLPLALTSMEDNGETIPEPTPIDKVEHMPDQIVTLIYADTIEHRKKFNNKSMNVTLTLPTWLYTIARHNEINMSQTLKDALKEKLGLME